MVNSMESSRPIIASSAASNRASKRFSTMSGAPSVAASENTLASNGDSRIHDIKEWSTGLERLNSKHLQAQRYTASTEKSDELSKLALGAKLERAFERRMTGQDAVMRPRPTRPVLVEKSG